MFRMCCAPQQANHLDSSDEEDSFERIEDAYDMDESDSEVTEEEETIEILEQELARLRNEVEKKVEIIRLFIGFFIITLFAGLVLCVGRPPPAQAAECPKIPECPLVPQCEEKKCELRLCPDEWRVPAYIADDGVYRRSVHVKDRVVTEVDEMRYTEGGLEVGHELVFVDGVNVESKTDAEILTMIWSNSERPNEWKHTDMIVRNSTRGIDYVKEVCFMIELLVVMFLIFSFIVNVLEPAVWARDKKAIIDKKKHSREENNAESPKIVDLGEVASETINSQNVAIEDNRVELEMYEARLAAAKSELATLESRLKELIEKTANVEEMENASINELDMLEKALNQFNPTNGEEREEPKAGVITRSHKRLSRSNGMFLDAPSLLA